jgi:hypothetical protein
MSNISGCTIHIGCFRLLYIIVMRWARSSLNKRRLTISFTCRANKTGWLHWLLFLLVLFCCLCRWKGFKLYKKKKHRQYVLIFPYHRKLGNIFFFCIRNNLPTKPSRGEGRRLCDNWFVWSFPLNYSFFTWNSSTYYAMMLSTSIVY